MNFLLTSSTVLEKVRALRALESARSVSPVTSLSEVEARFMKA